MGLFDFFKKLFSKPLSESDDIEELLRIAKGFSRYERENPFPYYLKAAQLGNVSAQDWCNWKYFFDADRSRNKKAKYQKSLFWYEKAAESGHVKAMYHSRLI